MVLATACWSSGQIKNLCGIHTHTHTRSCLTWRGCGTEDSVFWLWKFVFGSMTLSGTKSSLQHWIDGRNKTYLYFSSLQPENISKAQVQARLAPHYHRELFLKWQQHLILVKVAPVDLCLVQDLRPSGKILQQCTLKTIKLDLRGLQRCGYRLLCAGKGQWFSAWDVICTLKIEVLRVSGNLFPRPTNIAPAREKKFLLNHIPCHVLQEIQLHCNLTGPPSRMHSITGRNVVMWCMTV